MPLFELRNVVKTYNPKDKPALDIKSLDIPGGKVVALIGVSGSGKTTLLNILGLLDQADSEPRATILLNGKSLPELNEAECREQRSAFGFVFQQGYLLENLPSRENLRIPPELHGYSPADADIETLLASVDLGKPKPEGDRRPSDLSAGQRQRIAILRALSHRPEVIFADEPTSSLDLGNADRVVKILREWQQGGEGRTVLLVTHDTGLAVKYADAAILMAGGQAQDPISLEGVSAKDLSDELSAFTEKVRGPEESPKELPFKAPKHNESRTPRLDTLRVAWSLAWHDVFARIPRGTASRLRRVVPYRLLQFHSLASLALALLLALFSARLFVALESYLVRSISDGPMNQIIVLGHRVGADQLGPDDLDRLKDLSWVGGRIQVPDPEKRAAATKVVLMASPARNYPISARIAHCEYPSPCSITLNAVSVPANDKILGKIMVQAGPDLEHMKDTGRSIRSLFLRPDSGVAPGADADLIPDSALDPVKFGIVCTPRALKALRLSTAPQSLTVTLSTRDENVVRTIPVLGVASELPADREAMITEGLYLQEYFKGGLDTAPKYSQISLYIRDLLGDGLPLCDALLTMDYVIPQGQRERLIWVVQLRQFISIFESVAIVGLVIVVFSQLARSFWDAIRRKEKEIGVLLAYGIRPRDLYLTFWLQVALIWAMAALFATVLDGLAISRLVAAAYAKLSGSSVLAPTLPLRLWAEIVFGSLAIATLCVIPALRTVDSKRVANMLKAVN
jgi:ABC-type lipoprotein export system ATPase subunit